MARGAAGSVVGKTRHAASASPSSLVLCVNLSQRVTSVLSGGVLSDDISPPYSVMGSQRHSERFHAVIRKLSLRHRLEEPGAQEQNQAPLFARVAADAPVGDACVSVLSSVMAARAAAGLSQVVNRDSCYSVLSGHNSEAGLVLLQADLHLYLVHSTVVGVVPLRRYKQPWWEVGTSDPTEGLVSSPVPLRSRLTKIGVVDGPLHVRIDVPDALWNMRLLAASETVSRWTLHGEEQVTFRGWVIPLSRIVEDELAQRDGIARDQAYERHRNIHIPFASESIAARQRAILRKEHAARKKVDDDYHRSTAATLAVGREHVEFFAIVSAKRQAIVSHQQRERAVIDAAHRNVLRAVRAQADLDDRIHQWRTMAASGAAHLEMVKARFFDAEVTAVYSVAS